MNDISLNLPKRYTVLQRLPWLLLVIPLLCPPPGRPPVSRSSGCLSVCPVSDPVLPYAELSRAIRSVHLRVPFADTRVDRFPT